MSDHPPPEFPRVYRTVQPDLGYEGFIVIDSLLNGRSAGGIRMTPEVSQEEVAELARMMTLKFGFANVHFGGAKAGIRIAGPLSPQRRREVMESFGREFRDVIASGQYHPAEDIGTTPADAAHAMQAAGRSVRGGGGASSGRYTALTVVAAAEVLCRHARVAVRGASVAVEGFGKVGSETARLLAQQGARVVAASTVEGAVYHPRSLDLGRLQEYKNRHGDACVLRYREGEPITLEQLIALDVDILILAGKPYAVHAGNAARVRAAVIVPGGNLAVAADAEEVLVGRGRMMVPDFVVNCGGVLGLAWHGMGLPDDRIRRLVEGEYVQKLECLVAAASPSRTARYLAESVAAKNILRMRREVDPRRSALAHATTRLRRASFAWMTSKALQLVFPTVPPRPSTLAAYARDLFWADRPVYRRGLWI